MIRFIIPNGVPEFIQFVELWLCEYSMESLCKEQVYRNELNSCRDFKPASLFI